MSKIVKLDPTYQLWLSYTWSTNNHGICGHLFEVLDYFYTLKNHFKVGILLCEDITWDDVECSIRHKYMFSDDEIEQIRANTVFADRPKLITGQNILFTDGGVVNNADVVLLFKNILYFACGNKQIKDNTKPNVWVLQDDRVYDPVIVNGINYKKRILFDKLKPVDKYEDNLLVYATKNCRAFTEFDGLRVYGKRILVITEYPGKEEPGVQFIKPPVCNLFNRFSVYVYTPVPRKFDCSPRFLAECVHYGREVIFHNIDYWDEDKGLYWRWWDIQHDFQSLSLTDNDDIVTILQGIL